jgi:hypothetical protein
MNKLMKKKTTKQNKKLMVFKLLQMKHQHFDVSTVVNFFGDFRNIWNI